MKLVDERTNLLTVVEACDSLELPRATCYRPRVTPEVSGSRRSQLRLTDDEVSAGLSQGVGFNRRCTDVSAELHGWVQWRASTPRDRTGQPGRKATLWRRRSRLQTATGGLKEILQPAPVTVCAGTSVAARVAGRGVD